MSSSALSVFLSSPGVSRVLLNSPPSSAAAVVMEWIISDLRQAWNVGRDVVISRLELLESLIDSGKTEKAKHMLQNYFASAMDDVVLRFQSCTEPLGQIQFKEFFMKNTENITRLVVNGLRDASTMLDGLEIAPLTAAGAVVVLGVLGGQFFRRKCSRRARDPLYDEDLQNGEGRAEKRARIGEDDNSHLDQDVTVPTGEKNTPLVIDTEPRESDAMNGIAPSVMPEATGTLHHEYDDLTERASVTTPDNERSPGFNAEEATHVVDHEDEEDQSNTEDEDGSDKDVIANVSDKSDEEDDASSDDSVDDALSIDSEVAEIVPPPTSAPKRATTKSVIALSIDSEVEQIIPSRTSVPKRATTKPVIIETVVDLTGIDDED